MKMRLAAVDGSGRHSVKALNSATRAHQCPDIPEKKIKTLSRDTISFGKQEAPPPVLPKSDGIKAFLENLFAPKQLEEAKRLAASPEFQEQAAETLKSIKPKTNTLVTVDTNS